MTTTKNEKNYEYIIEKLNEEEETLFLKLFPMLDGIVRLQPGGWFYPSTFPAVLNQIHNFEVSFFIYVKLSII